MWRRVSESSWFAVLLPNGADGDSLSTFVDGLQSRAKRLNTSVRAGRAVQGIRAFRTDHSQLGDQAERDGGQRNDGFTTAEQEQLKRLRRENKQLKLECEILAKPRPGSRGRPTRFLRSLRTRESASATYPVATMCQVLEVSTSGYYAWRKRAPSLRAQRDARLKQQIRTIHDCLDGTYGRPRIHSELAEIGERRGRSGPGHVIHAHQSLGGPPLTTRALVRPQSVGCP